MVTLIYQHATLEAAELTISDPARVEAIWLRYHARLMIQVRHHLAQYGILSEVDAEDVVSNAFCSLLRGFRRGKYSGIENSDEWWYLMRAIAHRQALNFLRLRPRWYPTYGLDELMPDLGLPPDVAALNREIVDRILIALPPTLQLIVQLRLESYTIREIAERVGRAPRTLFRDLSEIRRICTGTGMGLRFANPAAAKRAQPLRISSGP